MSAFLGGSFKEGCTLASDESGFKVRGKEEGEQLKHSLVQSAIWFRLVGGYKRVDSPFMRQGTGLWRVCIYHCQKSERRHLSRIGEGVSSE